MSPNHFTATLPARRAVSPHHSLEDEPSRWLHSSPLLDLEDTKLRLRVQSLTQLCASQREKALALYGFVKRIPFAMPFRMREHTAREVLEQKNADATDKATLLVAMLRAAGVPARVRYLTLDPGIYRGLVDKVPHPTRPLVEVFRDGAWAGTDTYIYDASYFAAAHRRLKEYGWSFGFGIHVAGDTLWDGQHNAYVNSTSHDADPLVTEDHGVFCDALEFHSSAHYRERHARLLRVVHWNVVAVTMDRAIRALREDPAFVAPGA